MGAADRDYLRAPRGAEDAPVYERASRRSTWRWDWRATVALILLLCFLAGAVASVPW